MDSRPIKKRFDTLLNLRHAKQLFGWRALRGFSQPAGHIATRDLTAVNRAGLKLGQNTLAAEAVLVHDNSPIVENEDPWKTRIIRRWRTPLEKWQRRIRRLLGIFQKRVLSPEEQRENEENAQRKLLAKFHISQAEICTRQMVTVLTRLGLCKKKIQDGNERVIDRVWFDVVKFGPMAYYFHVGKFPDGISVMDLYNDQVTTDLSESVGHRVRSEYRADNGQGLVFIVEIASAMGIPEFVGFQDMKEAMPDNLPALSFPAGVAPNGRHVRRSLEDMPHLLVAGGTGSGKSNMINAIICTLIMRNTPEQLRVILFDLKRGVEFWAYEGIPHLQPLTGLAGDLQKGIIETLDDVLRAFDWIIEVGDERLDKIKAAGFRDITGYNARRKGRNRMGRLVIVIDEWANISLMLGRKAESKLTRITNLYRAAGIHVILATQNPKAEIINTVITTNFTSRMAFNMPSAASQTVLGNWHALGLSPKGRFILQTPEEEIQLQAPRITDGTINNIVKELISGKGETVEMSSLDPEEVLEFALENLGGSMQITQLYQHYRDRITQARLKELLKSMDNKEFTINETLYKIIPGEGSAPRTMEKVI
jgi:hypothetical protein